ncbi:BMC domain-containing protein [Clostridium tetani]|uniref:Ethanolamine utilization protein eutM n=1 Tax=Clostridium tetani (strain Massachusetts / E88) TaxID=212717 RepID=Q892D2_CLOTE|nr:BMC domain-containing protein [Clostridium tetani]AAO36663.1 ethanolamine utilization protein eutM [Clostridium tetani E88]AVP54044.1 BMC domain-containing protein [Clostridium tetani]KGI39327.1 carbon dioxide concentrating mechanism protein [Clostridium tetani ATCC 9441]KGI41051.1 carbon dioxide concentrating mechanism protein [Clostridium tetani]KGI45262.1 carbon dioxide concentrating mechanism protein [Clostridium tetani]
MKESTLGFLETYGFIAAIEGLDVALKSADVKFVSCEFVTNGIVTIVITGDVASVKASIEAACVAIERIGTLRNAHVISRAYDEVWKIFQKKTVIDNIDSKVEEVKQVKKDLEKENLDNSLEVEKNESISEEELKSLKVQELRTMARALKEQHKISLTSKQIKFSKKEQLIEAILNSL